MTRRLVWITALLLGAAPAEAAVQRVIGVDPARSQIRFVTKQMNAPVEGGFRKFSAQLDFDPAGLGTSRARIDVDLGSIDTGSDEADAEVKGKAWFNLSVFPTATFVSTGLRALGSGRYEARGRLTIKGITREITAPFTVTEQGGASVFEGSFTLLRLPFGIGEGPWADTETVANDVRVLFKLTGRATAEPPPGPTHPPRRKK